MKKNAIIFTLLLLSSCSSLLKYERQNEDFKHDEFDKQVKIEVVEDESVAEKVSAEKSLVPDAAVQEVAQPTEKKAAPPKSSPAKLPPPIVSPAKKPITKKAAKSRPSAAAKSSRRQPEIEDDEGFENQRRPQVDPFKVGEKVVHDVSYLGARAGTLTMAVRPFATVNGKKSYNFYIDIKSTSFFSRVYAVDDQVQTFVDFDNLVPHVFKLNIRDSGQVKEAQSYFNFDTMKANYWEHRYTEKGGHEEKKLEWTILPYSQNPFSGIFYMRVFKWKPGRQYVFRVADDEKNVTFSGKAIEKTKLNTDAGTFDALKIKAEIVSHGNLAKATDFYLWISDDDRKFILRIEVKLPIGSLVSEVTEIQKGN